MGIRVAATADVHYGPEPGGVLTDVIARMDEEADVLLVAGDLTRHGLLEEALRLGEDLARCPVPVVAVLGNHDVHSDAADRVAEAIRAAGVHVIEGGSVAIELDGATLGVAGVKGFGGGFAGGYATAFGERLMKDFVAETRDAADRLQEALEGLATDRRVALMHYSPIEATLCGEPVALYPFLGSFMLEAALDHSRPDLALHGHAHAGSPEGATSAGVPVMNVAVPVTRRPFVVRELA